MAEQRTFKPRKFNQPDMMNNWLYGKPVEQGAKRPSLRVRVAGNSPRFVVNTNVKNDANNGRIEFNMDYMTFSAIMSTIYRMAKGEITETVRYEYQDNFVAGKKLPEVITLATTEIGRLKTGQMYICVRSTQNGRPSIPFVFGPSTKHGVIYVGDREITPKEVSEFYAMGFARMQLDIIGQLLVTDFDEEGKGIAKPPAQQGGSGNQRQGGGNFGGSQRRAPQQQSQPADDPFDGFDGDF